MRTVYHTRPYEVKPGSVNKLHRQWAAKCKRDIAKGKFLHIPEEYPWNRS